MLGWGLCRVQFLQRSGILTRKWGLRGTEPFEWNVRSRIRIQIQPEQAKPVIPLPRTQVVTPRISVGEFSYWAPCCASQVWTTMLGTASVMRNRSAWKGPDLVEWASQALPFVDGLKVPQERSSPLSVHSLLSGRLFASRCSDKSSLEFQEFQTSESSPLAAIGFLGTHCEDADCMPGTRNPREKTQDFPDGGSLALGIKSKSFSGQGGTRMGLVRPSRLIHSFKPNPDLSVHLNTPSTHQLWALALAAPFPGCLPQAFRGWLSLVS